MLRARDTTDRLPLNLAREREREILSERDFTSMFEHGLQARIVGLLDGIFNINLNLSANGDGFCKDSYKTLSPRRAASRLHPPTEETTKHAQHTHFN